MQVEFEDSIAAIPTQAPILSHDEKEILSKDVEPGTYVDDTTFSLEERFEVDRIVQVMKKTKKTKNQNKNTYLDLNSNSILQLS